MYIFPSHSSPGHVLILTRFPASATSAKAGLITTGGASSPSSSPSPVSSLAFCTFTSRKSTSARQTESDGDERHPRKRERSSRCSSKCRSTGGGGAGAGAGAAAAPGGGGGSASAGSCGTTASSWMLQATLAPPTHRDILAEWQDGTRSREQWWSSNCMWVRIAGGTYLHVDNIMNFRLPLWQLCVSKTHPSTGYSTTVKNLASQSTHSGWRTSDCRRTPTSENLKARLMVFRLVLGSKRILATSSMTSGPDDDSGLTQARPDMSVGASRVDRASPSPPPPPSWESGRKWTEAGSSAAAAQGPKRTRAEPRRSSNADSSCGSLSRPTADTRDRSEPRRRRTLSSRSSCCWS